MGLSCALSVLFLQTFCSIFMALLFFYDIWKQTKGSHDEDDVTAFCFEIRTVSLGTEGVRGEGVINSAL